MKLVWSEIVACRNVVAGKVIGIPLGVLTVPGEVGPILTASLTYEPEVDRKYAGTT